MMTEEQKWIDAKKVRETADKSEYQEWYKYVRVGDEFRFADVDTMIAHRDMVEKGETAESAGMIAVNSKGFAFREYGSQSLKLAWSEDDEPRLEKALGLAALTPYDLRTLR